MKTRPCEWCSLETEEDQLWALKAERSQTFFSPLSHGVKRTMNVGLDPQWFFFCSNEHRNYWMVK